VQPGLTDLRKGVSRAPYARLLTIASIGAFIAALSTSLVAVSVPVIARDLHVTPADVSWILSAYLLSVSSILALAGKAADLIGRKRVYLTGFTFFAAGSGMCAAAPVLRALVGARVIQGIGAGMLMAVGPALVTRAVPPDKRARGLGIQLAATYFGLTLGPSLGGLLAANMGWHAVFLVITVAGAGGGVAALAVLPGDVPQEHGERPSVASLDIPGAVLFGAGLAAMLVALKRAPEHGWASPPVLGIGLLALVSLGVFVRHETRASAPLLPLALFKKPPFTLGVLGAVLLYTVTFMLAYLLPVQLQRGAGLGAAAAGAYMTAQPATMAVVAPVSGVIADRFGPRIPSASGMLAIGAGLCSLAAAGAVPGAVLVVSLALIGAGAGLYVAPNSALIMGAAPKNRQGVAGAMAATARNLGMTLGVALAASLHEAIGFRGVVALAASLAALGVVLAAVRPSTTDDAKFPA
jgi:EmrB/QacA subfamily drug resistance transporter